ncbi:unnamed protein product [Rhizopus microsporus]
MEEVTHVLKTASNQDVKHKVLYLVQTWGIAAKGNPSLSYITGTYSLLKAEGYAFPPVTEKIDSIFLETAVAPEWTDSDVCERCRTPFTLTNRKHHCRNCGGTFCQQCSSKNVPLPHLGINDVVRVCDGCYIKVKLSKIADKETVSQLLGTPTTTSASTSSSLAPVYAPSTSQKTTETAKDDDQFEEDLKKAIEMSLKESQQQQQQQKSVSYSSKQKEEEQEDADLAAAIAASLADMKISSASSPSAATSKITNDKSNELSLTDMENIQLFSTLMHRIQSIGGDVSGDQQVNQLYTEIGSLQPKLVTTLNETCQKHERFVQLHQKLNEAVKAYDRLLHQRLSQAHRNSGYDYSYPVQNYYSPVANQYPPPITTAIATATSSQQAYIPPASSTNVNSANATAATSPVSAPNPSVMYPDLGTVATSPPIQYPATQQQPMQYNPSSTQPQFPLPTSTSYPQAYYPPTPAQMNTQYPPVQPQQSIQYPQQAISLSQPQQATSQQQQQQQQHYSQPQPQKIVEPLNTNHYYNQPIQPPQHNQQQQQPVVDEAPLIEL